MNPSPKFKFPCNVIPKGNIGHLVIRVVKLIAAISIDELDSYLVPGIDPIDMMGYSGTRQSADVSTRSLLSPPSIAIRV